MNQNCPSFQPSPEQQLTISQRGGHLQVIACAGSGKTEAIARRVSSLIEEGTEPGQIVAVTVHPENGRFSKGKRHLEVITTRLAMPKPHISLNRSPILYADSQLIL